MNNFFNITRDYFGRDANDPRNLIQVLGGKWYGQYGTAPCPICQLQKKSHQNALTSCFELNGKLLLHCKKHNCSFVDILAAAGMRRGYGLAEAKLNASSGNATLILKDLGKCSIALSKLWGT